MTSANVIASANNRAARRSCDWGDRHVRQFAAAPPIARLIQAWADYADQHRTRHESPIGDDGVLGVEWERIGRALLGLLNGELDDLDGGTLDGMIRAVAAVAGVELD